MRRRKFFFSFWTLKIHLKLWHLFFCLRVTMDENHVCKRMKLPLKVGFFHLLDHHYPVSLNEEEVKNMKLRVELVKLCTLKRKSACLNRIFVRIFRWRSFFSNNCMYFPRKNLVLPTSFLTTFKHVKMLTKKIFLIAQSWAWENGFCKTKKVSSKVLKIGFIWNCWPAHNFLISFWQWVVQFPGEKGGNLLSILMRHGKSAKYFLTAFNETFLTKLTFYIKWSRLLIIGYWLHIWRHFEKLPIKQVRLLTNNKIL